MNNSTDQQHATASPDEAIPTTHNGSPWWRAAANPPCPDWCTDTHQADEFAQGGSIVHQAVVAEGDGVTLTHVAVVSVPEAAAAPGTIETVYDEVEVTTDRKGVQLSSADGFGVPLAGAVSLAREVLRLAGSW